MTCDVTHFLIFIMINLFGNILNKSDFLLYEIISFFYYVRTTEISGIQKETEHNLHVNISEVVAFKLHVA